MPSWDWQVAAEIATTVSTIAFAASAIVVVLQLRQAARERYFSVTAHLFEIWQSPEFQHDQLFILHKLSSSTWDDFIAEGRGERPDRAIHRVGSFYDRVGNLVRHGLIRRDDILPTIGGYAVAVWHRIEPLVKELRLRENALLFENFESLLPECHDCYVPGVATGDSSIRMNNESESVTNRSIGETSQREPMGANGAATLPINELDISTKRKTEMAKLTIDSSSPPALRVRLADSDGIAHSLSEFTTAGPAVMVYARGAWCPFCLRQLSDYADRYREFKKAGIEVVAVSPESPRRSRRLRMGLKLPFTVLSDSKYEAAKIFGLIGHEKSGEPTPATLVLDSQHGLTMSTLNEREKCLLARDMLEYMRAVKQSAAPTSVPMPKVDLPKPGALFVRALANMAAGFFVR